MKPELALPAAVFVLTAILSLVRCAESAAPSAQSDGEARNQPAKTLEIDLGSKVNLKFVQMGR